ncbi:MAG: class I SAM-dependent methyltransferase [Candidatus Thorarchaeota archaeon]
MTRRTEAIYSSVVHAYEMVNHLTTFWLDSLFRRRVATLVAHRPGGVWADMGCGTGETFSLLRREAKRGQRIVGVDISMPMLRAAAGRGENDVQLVLADARSLPFRDGSVQVLVSTYALRGICDEECHPTGQFREFRRILRPNGCVVVLETSRPESWFVRFLFRTYVSHVVTPLGSLISGAALSYRFLRDSIIGFYSARGLSSIMINAGFRKVRYESLMRGMFALHQAVA